MFSVKSAVKQEQQTKHESKNMNNKFDELTKCMAQSVTRRGALKKFGIALAGMALACFGLANKAHANDWCQQCIKACRATGSSANYCHQFCGFACKGSGGA